MFCCHLELVMHEKTLSLSLPHTFQLPVKPSNTHFIPSPPPYKSGRSLELQSYGSYGEWSLHQVTIIPHCSSLLFCSFSFPLLPVRSGIHACWQLYCDLNAFGSRHSSFSSSPLLSGLGFCGEFIFELRTWWTCVQGCVFNFRTVTLHSGFMMVRQSGCMLSSFSNVAWIWRVSIGFQLW